MKPCPGVTPSVTTVDVFDGVMVATGHHAVPYEPQYEGRDAFKGKQLHSQEYRDPDEFRGKRVVVVGASNSGGDIAVELGRVCRQVFLVRLFICSHLYNYSIKLVLLDHVW